MQTPSQKDFKWCQGRTNNLTFGLYSDAARTVPIDITGVRWIFEARTGTIDSGAAVVLRRDSSVNGEFTITAPDDGLFTVNIAPAATNGAAWRKLFYQIIGVWPNGGPTLEYFVGQIILGPALASVT